MEITSYLSQIIISVIIFIILCILANQVKKIIEKHYGIHLNPNDFLPIEEIKSLMQLYFLLIILLIYICIMNFFFNNFGISGELIFINSLIDIILSVFLVTIYYDGSTRGKIISIFLLPIVSISYILFGGSLIRYWDFIRIPILLYLVVIFYNKFIDYTERNNLGKTILILLSIIYTGILLTIVLEKQNPIDAVAMVTNAITSNGYAALGDSEGGVLTSVFLAWGGYIISGVATATLAADIIHRNSRKKFRNMETKIDNLENKIDNLERIIVESQKENEE